MAASAKKKPMFLVLPDSDGQPKITVSCGGYSTVLTLCFKARNTGHRLIDANEVAKLGKGLIAASARMRDAHKRRR